MIKNRQHANVSCGNCSVASLCIPRHVNNEETEKLNALITNVCYLESHEFVYSQAQEMKNIYALRSGCCKEYSLNADGDETIHNFFLPGDLLGLESIAVKRYSFTIETVQPSVFCVIPYEPLLELLSECPDLKRRFINITSYKMQNSFFIPNTTNAKARTAAFLLNVCFRLRERGRGINHLQLPMSQYDISKFLGLAPETLCRILHDFQYKDLLVLKNKTISLLNLDVLQEIAGCKEYVTQAETA